jgi:hypothetical protein
MPISHLAITVPKINSLKIYLKQKELIFENPQGLQILHIQCNHTVSIVGFWEGRLNLEDLNFRVGP